MKQLTWVHATSVSTAASSTSDVVSIPANQNGVAVQIAWTGTTAGTVKLQGSNDAAQWDDLTGLSDTPAGSASQNMWVVSYAYFQYLRVVFTRSGGTGLLSGTWSSKRIL